MNPIELTILIKVGGQEIEVLTRPNEYRSLMHLVADNLLLDGFGECNGMGKCGTCLVKVSSCSGALTSLDRNEQTTLEKARINQDKMRLSCQILIDETIDELVIHIS